jgi:hypothetical protein
MTFLSREECGARGATRPTNPRNELAKLSIAWFPVNAKWELLLPQMKHGFQNEDQREFLARNGSVYLGLVRFTSDRRQRAKVGASNIGKRIPFFRVKEV